MGIREPLLQKGFGAEAGFRWRGGDVSRVEAFSDAVFGFALTLLVVSLEVPRTFEQLLSTMRGFVAFGACFWLLYMIWERHYTFFRRYGLQDGRTRALNGVLLFVVLLYVYPLKFLFTLFVNTILGIAKAVGTSTIATAQVPLLFMIYGLGFAAVFGILALFHVNALQSRAALNLTLTEEKITRASILRNGLMAGIGLLSIVAAKLLPLHSVGLAGYLYLLVCGVETLHGWLEGEAMRNHLRTGAVESVDDNCNEDGIVTPPAGLNP